MFGRTCIGETRVNVNILFITEITETRVQKNVFPKRVNNNVFCTPQQKMKQIF